MKKFINIILIFIVIFSFVGCDLGESERYPPGGKDTVTRFGDGRFILSDPSKNDFYWLVDQKKCIDIDYVNKYTDILPFVYTIGEKGYTKINYDLGLYHQSSSLDHFDENDQEIFKLLENTSGKIPYFWGNTLERNSTDNGPLIYLDDDGLYVVYERDSNAYDMTYELFDRKNNKIVDYISKYKIFNSCIYAIGKKGYTKINLLNTENPFSQSMNLDDFNNEDQIVFKVLDSEESTLEY